MNKSVTDFHFLLICISMQQLSNEMEAPACIQPFLKGNTLPFTIQTPEQPTMLILAIKEVAWEFSSSGTWFKVSLRSSNNGVGGATDWNVESVATHEQVHTSSCVISPDVAVLLLPTVALFSTARMLRVCGNLFASEGEGSSVPQSSFWLQFLGSDKNRKMGILYKCKHQLVHSIQGPVASRWWEHWGDRFTHTEVLQALLLTAGGLSSLPLSFQRLLHILLPIPAYLKIG